MHYLLRLLLVPVIAVVLACGGSTNKHTVTPTKPDTPWTNLTGTEAEVFANLACPSATDMVTEAKTWPLLKLRDGAENPRLFTGETHRYIEVRTSPAGIPIAFQYRVENKGKVVIEAALVFFGDVQVYLLDFYTIQALTSGKVTGEDKPETLHRFATGEFFCVFE